MQPMLKIKLDINMSALFLFSKNLVPISIFLYVKIVEGKKIAECQSCNVTQNLSTPHQLFLDSWVKPIRCDTLWVIYSIYSLFHIRVKDDVLLSPTGECQDVWAERGLVRHHCRKPALQIRKGKFHLLKDQEKFIRIYWIMLTLQLQKIHCKWIPSS